MPEKALVFSPLTRHLAGQHHVDQTLSDSSLLLWRQRGAAQCVGCVGLEDRTEDKAVVFLNELDPDFDGGPIPCLDKFDYLFQQGVNPRSAALRMASWCKVGRIAPNASAYFLYRF